VEEQAVERRRNTGVYYVEPGDSFWKISQKLYGTGAFFKALQAHNRERFPNPADLNVGDELATPTADELRAKYSGLCPKVRKTKPGTPQVRAVSTLAARPTRPYVVEEGDTLYDIAKYELGAASRWPEIFQLNREALSADIDYLRPGIKILLPAREDQPGDMLTRQPDETLRR
jgi:nucleoid-associated protein YgaU